MGSKQLIYSHLRQVIKQKKKKVVCFWWPLGAESAAVMKMRNKKGCDFCFCGVLQNRNNTMKYSWFRLKATEIKRSTVEFKWISEEFKWNSLKFDRFLSKIRRFLLFSSVFLLNLKEIREFRINFDRFIIISRIFHLFWQNTWHYIYIMYNVLRELQPISA